MGNMRARGVLEEADPRLGAWLAGKGVGAEPPARRGEVEVARRGDTLRREVIQEW